MIRTFSLSRTSSLFFSVLALALTARADEPRRATIRIDDASLSPLPLARGEASVVASLPLAVGRGAPRIAVLFHGWDSCAPGLVRSGLVRCGGRSTTGYGLGRETERAGTDTLLLVPQLALLARDSSPGRFEEPGFSSRWLSTTLDAIARARGEASIARFRTAPVALLAHSGGYVTLLALLHEPGWRARTDAVVLFDGLYAGADSLAVWVSEDARRRVLSIHTANATTTSGGNELLAAAAQRGVPTQADLSDLAAGWRDSRVATMRTTTRHHDVPRRHLAEVLAAFSAP